MVDLILKSRLLIQLFLQLTAYCTQAPVGLQQIWLNLQLLHFLEYSGQKMENWLTAWHSPVWRQQTWPDGHLEQLMFLIFRVPDSMQTFFCFFANGCPFWVIQRFFRYNKSLKGVAKSGQSSATWVASYLAMSTTLIVGWYLAIQHTYSGDAKAPYIFLSLFITALVQRQWKSLVNWNYSSKARKGLLDRSHKLVTNHQILAIQRLKSDRILLAIRITHWLLLFFTLRLTLLLKHRKGTFSQGDLILILILGDFEVFNVHGVFFLQRQSVAAQDEDGHEDEEGKSEWLHFNLKGILSVELN